MKRFLTLLLMAFSLNALAQNGTYFLGGNLGISTSDDIEDLDRFKSNSWSFSPELGFFLTDNAQIGIAFGIRGSSSERNLFSTGEKANTQELAYGAAVYGRYFFGDFNRSFRPFCGINVGYFSGTREESTVIFGLPPAKDIANIMSFNMDVNMGISYTLSKRVFVLASLRLVSYLYDEERYNNFENSRNRFRFDLVNLGNRLNIGLYYTFPGK